MATAKKYAKAARKAATKAARASFDADAATAAASQYAHKAARAAGRARKAAETAEAETAWKADAADGLKTVAHNKALDALISEEVNEQQAFEEARDERLFTFLNTLGSEELRAFSEVKTAPNSEVASEEVMGEAHAKVQQLIEDAN